MTATRALTRSRCARLLSQAYPLVGLARRQVAQDFPVAFLAEHPAVERELGDLAAALIGQALRESWQHAGFTPASASASGDARTTTEELRAQFLARRAVLAPMLALAASRRTGG